MHAEARDLLFMMLDLDPDGRYRSSPHERMIVLLARGGSDLLICAPGAGRTRMRALLISSADVTPLHHDY